ncbi:MAG: 30S ribosomal protein S7 [Candidatus Coatesbacteria bacterium]
MPRHGRAPRRDVDPDTRYQSKLVSKIVNCIMKDGERATAEGVVYGAMDTLEKRGLSAINVLKTAIENVKPVLEVRARRVGGANYQVPIEVRPERRLALAIRWILTATEARTERSLIERLAGELGEAAAGTGAAMKKRDEVHKMAEANRAFAHYRW